MAGSAARRQPRIRPEPRHCVPLQRHGDGSLDLTHHFQEAHIRQPLVMVSSTRALRLPSIGTDRMTVLLAEHPGSPMASLVAEFVPAVNRVRARLDACTDRERRPLLRSGGDNEAACQDERY